MSLRLFSDQCVPAEITDILRRHGHQVTLLREVLPIRSPDPVVIARAQELGAILLSLNGDFADIVTYPPGHYRASWAFNCATTRRSSRNSWSACWPSWTRIPRKSPTTANCFSWKCIGSESGSEPPGKRRRKQSGEAGVSNLLECSRGGGRVHATVVSNPNFFIFLATQIRAGDKSFLSKDISVHDLVTHKGDIHHIFPKEYLKKNGLAKSDYNQVANYAYMQSEINIRIGSKSPKEYLAGVKEQCNRGEPKYGRIDSMDGLLVNFRMNAVPEAVFEMELADYENFLAQRRRLMAVKMRDFYSSL